jgi:SAM-dependent methyltransferase
VLDCGCGPIGALPILAELVGADGHVYGVDINERAVAQARTNLDALGVHGVELLAGDVRAFDDLSIPADLDLIYARCFLMHQADAGGLLRQLATRLRPGGGIVAHEPLRAPAPMGYPDNVALADAWSLLSTVIERGGAPRKPSRTCRPRRPPPISRRSTPARPGR